MPSYKESTSHKKEKVKVIKFDLEICLLPRLDMLGEQMQIYVHVWYHNHSFVYAWALLTHYYFAPQLLRMHGVVHAHACIYSYKSCVCG